MSGESALGATQLARVEAVKAAKTALLGVATPFGAVENKRTVEEIAQLAEYIISGTESPETPYRRGVLGGWVEAWPPSTDIRPILDYERQMVKVLAEQTMLPISRDTICSDASCEACAQVRRNREYIEARRRWMSEVRFV